ncbi:gp27 [Mycobacterium phage Konstantine]|uniref:Uncharacterized protein n=1 Tax=Mycobacterium phage Konstantine TaxID=563121 RepID=B5U4Z7_9CAUD|nr:gp27 [Mycobacterium phage Konstantine]ACI12443.1 hypothetical protein KONSTANTINE_27 [Mycobacterium phage Konstantine]AXH47147.1 hypothetical protein SEA_CBORCH11_23 [Mycobacterium phage Cborch11]
MADIRCSNKKHGELTEQGSGILEIICNSRFCKESPNEVVRHRWNLGKKNPDGTIKLIETRRFKDPTKGNRK